MTTKDMKTAKHHTKYLAAAFALILLGACNDMLDLPSDGRIPREEIFANRDNVRGYLSGAYHKIPGLTAAEANFTDECEEASHSENNERYVRWYSGNVTAQDFGSYSKDGDPWGGLYQGIRRCNVFLDGIGGYTGLAFGENRNEVNAWTAQAYTLRALYYLQLIKRYGGVPYFLEELVPERDASGDTRMGFSQVALRIISDCRAALATPDYNDQFSFSWNIYENQDGVMHRGVAYAVMAEAALFAASPLYSDGSVTWQDALDICSEALRECLANGYELFTVAPGPVEAINSYAYYFLSSPFDRRVTDKETIFVNSNGMQMWREAGLPTTYGQESAGPCPVQELVDSYEMQATGEMPILGYSDGDHTQPIVNPASGYDPANPYEGRDPRFAASIYYNGAPRELGTATPSLVQTYEGGLHELQQGNRRYTQTGYYMRKYSDWRADGNTRNGDGMPRMYRLAWLYLNFAEAAYQATGDPDRVVLTLGDGTQLSARTAVNTVRARASMPPLPAGLSVAEFERRYRNERRVELAFEGHRYYDVRRWEILDETEPVVTGMEITDNGGNYTYNRFVVGRRATSADRFLYYPINEGEMRKIMANSGVSWESWQNAGW